MCSVQVPKFQADLNKFEIPKREEVKNNNNKRIIIIHTKDLENEDYKLLSSHGKYDSFDDKFINIHVDEIFNRLNLNYFLVDVREENARYFFNSIKNKTDYYIVALISRFEKYTQFNDELKKYCDSVVYKLPDKPVAFCEEFNKLLVNDENLTVPNKLTNFLFFLCNIGDYFKRK
jgi:hypothetical protein